MPALLETSLPLPLARRGKVRDVYDLGDSYLFVATDRISAFDVVLSPGIPDKGKILTQISTFWFRHFADIENHLLDADWETFPAEVRAIRSARPQCHRPEVHSRPRRMRRPWLSRRFGVEGVQRDRQGLRHRAREEPDDGKQIARPIFTPATKEETGHDENISFECMCALAGDDLAAELRDLTLRIYKRAREYADASALSSAARSSQRQIAQLRGQVIAGERAHALEGDVLIVAGLFLRRRSEDWLAQSASRRQVPLELDAANPAGLVVLLQPRTDEIATGDAFDGDDCALPDDDTAAAQIGMGPHFAGKVSQSASRR